MTPAELEEQKRAFMLAPKRLFGYEPPSSGLGLPRVAYETFPENMGGDPSIRDLRFSHEMQGHPKVRWAPPSIRHERASVVIIFKFEIIRFATGPHSHVQDFITCFNSAEDEQAFEAERRRRYRNGYR